MGKYSCFSCGKVFTNLQNLRRHYRNLHEGRRYRCGICSSLLSSASGLSRHLRINHGIQVSAPKHKPPVLLPTPPQPYYASRTSIACLTTPAVGGGGGVYIRPSLSTKGPTAVHLPPAETSQTALCLFITRRLNG